MFTLVPSLASRGHWIEFLPLYHMGTRNQAQIVTLGGKATPCAISSVLDFSTCKSELYCWVVTHTCNHDTGEIDAGGL